jgi:hypothetical protein
MDIHEIKNITITHEILKLIAEIDEFKGSWKVMESLAPEKLTTLRRIATIESVGSSTRIEGAKLSDREVEKLLSGVKAKSFASRDEQEVEGKPRLRPLPLGYGDGAVHRVQRGRGDAIEHGGVDKHTLGMDAQHVRSV